MPRRTESARNIWSLIKDWVRTTDDNEFNASWKYIEEDTSVPKSVAQYIARDWLPYKKMWSAMSRQNRTIFEKGDTNMLLEAYHHVLKSGWLDGKRNRRMDHLIHTLVKEFLPNIEHRHKWQTLGMEGPNLAEERRQQILTRAPETPVEKIVKIDDLHFEVQSSNSPKHYQINLITTTCNCSDFPNISLCKHIAAVVHFFGGADLGPQPPRNGSASASDSGEHESPSQRVGHGAADNDDAAASILLAANEIISLSQRLITEVPRDPRIAKSLNVIQSRLTALVLPATAADNAYLAETAARMGEKRGKKHGSGKVDSSLTAQHIGEPNHKRAGDNDPYGAGEQSGKRAKLDARSVAANVRACAAQEWAVPKAEPPPTQPPPPPPPHTPL
ncbi:hypothetical protein F5888DRAFT_1807194 [Russula emetica]|nr:hypothetical protein F5888DRAFT_1807194 [Russula emetica]